MKSIIIDDKKYYWITYKKILDDLPILDIGVKRLKKILEDLEKKEILKRHKIDKGKLYVYVDLDIMSGIKVPKWAGCVEQKFQNSGTKIPQIDNYNNKIKININNQIGLDAQDFMDKFLLNLKNLVGDTIFNYNIKDKIILSDITCDYVIFNIITKSLCLFKKLYLQKLNKAIDAVFISCT